MPFSSFIRALLVVLCMAFISGPAGAVPAPAGQLINNVAYADYLDKYGATQRVSSNLVRFEVAAVSAFSLLSSQARPGQAGSPVSFPHVLTNNGNIVDRFDLALANLGGGGFDFSSVVLYADGNNDGIPDGPPLASAQGDSVAWSPGSYATSPPLSPGQSLSYVVVARLPPSAGDGSSDVAQLLARGDPANAASGGYTPASPLNNNDTVTVAGGSVVKLSESFSRIEGPSPSDDLLVTLTYVNSGGAASNVLLVGNIGADSGVLSLPFLLGNAGAPNLPYNTRGLTYVLGSAKWSGSPNALSDADDGDEGGIRFSVGADGIIRALIPAIPAGGAGILTFKVNVKGGLPAGSTLSTSRFGIKWDSNGGSGVTTRYDASNAALYEVLTGVAGADLTLVKTGDSVMYLGAEGRFTLQVNNVGARPTSTSVTVTDSLPAGIRFLREDAAASGYWNCAGDGKFATGETVGCTTYQTIPAQAGSTPGAAPPLVLVVRPEASVITTPPVTLTNQASVAGGGEPAGSSGNNQASFPFTVEKQPPSGIHGRVWYDGDADGVFSGTADNPLSGWRVSICPYLPLHKPCAADPNGTSDPDLFATDAAGNRIPTAITGNDGVYRFVGLVPGRYKIVFRQPQGDTVFGYFPAGMSNPRQPTAAVILAGQTNDLSYDLPLDPTGVVYDSETRQAVAGAQLSLSGPAGFDPELHLFGGAGNLTQTTGANGIYQFLLIGNYPSGSYSIQIKALPAGYVAGPSVAYPPQAGAIAPPAGCRMVAGKCSVEPGGSPNPPVEPTSPHYYMAFSTGGGGAIDVINNHLPIDPAGSGKSGLLISKTANRQQAEIGDFVDYTVRINNTRAYALQAATVTDQLPFGFSYVKGSTRVGGIAQADPKVVGNQLTFAIGELAAKSTQTLTYRTKVGIGADRGDGTNRAQASAGGTQSNIARVKILVVGGVFSDKAYILGTIYADCNGDGLKDPTEPGVPGVRLFLEDGTWVVTDGEGRYSLYGLEPRAHVVKVDRHTLPSDSRLRVLDSRNAGNAGSRFADLKKGEAQRADFALECTPGVIERVEVQRAKQAEARQLSEADRASAIPLPVDGRQTRGGDARAQPATGILGQPASAAGAPGSQAAPGAPGFSPLGSGLPPASTPSRTGGGSPTGPSSGPHEGSVSPEFAPVGGRGPVGADLNSANSNLPNAAPQLEKPRAASDPVSLEDVLKALTDSSLAFISPLDGAVLPVAQTAVRLKGGAGTLFRLTINGEEVAASRVGKKAILAEKSIQAWEYFGIGLRPGENVLEATQTDPFGNSRGTVSIKVIAPSGLGKLVIDPPTQRVADGRTPLPVTVRLTDEHGVPVTTRTPITLEAKVGAWQLTDLNPAEPGVQVFIEGGRGVFNLLPPLAPADEEILVTSGVLRQVARFNYTPELRPLVAAGIVEGAFNLRNLDVRKLFPARERDSFEREIQRFMRESDDGRVSVGARASFYLKGKIKGDYLLTLAYDSDKDLSQRLIRDIQPDQFYPVYGDASIKGFDAQSTQRFYVRIDKGSSYALYGDFPTAATNAGRMLSQYSRALTGAKGHYENENVAANIFASRDTLRQFVDEFPANGTSGPYLLANKGFFINSEKVEILTRDRNQPDVILKIESQSRFSDYEIEPDAGRILFKRPIASRDENLNPVSIRVAYEVDQGGEKFWIVGADVQAKVADNVELGGVVVKDNNPNAPFEMAGANTTIRLDENTYLIAELARAKRGDTLTNGVTTPAMQGNASRVELKRRMESGEARAYFVRTDKTFDNPASPFNKGRSEAGVKGTMKLDELTRVAIEALRSEDLSTGAHREGAVVNLMRDLLPGVRGEFGLRHSRDALSNGAPANSAGSSANPPPADRETSVNTARARLTVQVPGVPEATAFGEYEHELGGSRRTAGVGGDYRIADSARLYLKHNFITGIDSPFALNNTQRNNTTLFGVESKYLENGAVVSEYRVRDALDGRHAEAMVGLRNQWQIAEGLRVSTSSERIRALDKSKTNSQAYTGAVEYLPLDYLKLTGRLEWRQSTTTDSILAGAGVAIKLDNDWTALTRAVFERSTNHGSGNEGDTRSERKRFQAGLAYRDSASNRLFVLNKLEYQDEHATTLSNPANRSVLLASSHANWLVTRNLTLSGRVAGKRVEDDTLGFGSRSRAWLASGRAVFDINDRWDAGLQFSVMSGDGRTQYGIGPELGYRVQDDLWVSVGYNVFGFRDKDFSSLDTFDRGVYFRMRFKFDEDLFGESKKTSAPRYEERSAALGQPLVMPAIVEKSMAKAEPTAVAPAAPVLELGNGKLPEPNRDLAGPPREVAPGQTPAWLQLGRESFLPEQANLSPAGSAKLASIVRWYLRSGKTVQVVVDGREILAAQPDEVLRARAESVRSYLDHAGIEKARVRELTDERQALIELSALQVAAAPATQPPEPKKDAAKPGERVGARR